MVGFMIAATFVLVVFGAAVLLAVCMDREAERRDSR
jgi:hypothetical protein